MPSSALCGIMSSFSSSIKEIDAVFLKFSDDLNTAEVSSSMGNNSIETTQPSLTPRRCVQSRLLELERYVHANGMISMSIAHGTEKPISPHVV
ncbi:CACTA en-spm transposon protein [Cucumis melo var. makuwa]|uniref:CACTA en-spm transposon protein n=1 Tax=Cucumis melo var. makuwa TaxID=1194695 RepID=A0A5D3BQY0_CUCMM|nr:CACTA en-spm transposon protein [Cucumis melo var. makuwa]